MENTTTPAYLGSYLHWQKTKKAMAKNLAQGIMMALKGHGALLAVDQ